MLLNKRVLGLVPARSGSKGIPNKNLTKIRDTSLIGRAGLCLQRLEWMDARVLSTDDAEYAKEGRKFGLDAPFTRPRELSSDDTSAIDTIAHALRACEESYDMQFDIVVLVEPTSPFRTPADIEHACRILVESECDSVVSVSPLDTKAHPHKLLVVNGGKLRYFDKHGKDVVARQQLPAAYFRNGVCYSLTRRCVLSKKSIITDNTQPYIVRRHVVNIDDPLDLAWAEFLLQKKLVKFDC